MSEAKLIRFVRSSSLSYEGGSVVSFTSPDYDSVFEEACKLLDIDVDSETANWIELAFLNDSGARFQFNSQSSFAGGVAWFKEELKVKNLTVLIRNTYVTAPPPGISDQTVALVVLAFAALLLYTFIFAFPKQ